MTWSREQLCYCTNVHPAETREHLQDCIPKLIRQVTSQRGLKRSSSGLWISAVAAESIARNDKTLATFKNCYTNSNIDIVTLNGFPYGGFHADVVKADVYSPDWSQPERLGYTINLARILAHCLPESSTVGTISTLPLGYRSSWSDTLHRSALSHLTELVRELQIIERATGKRIQVCLEMEPCCVLETTQDTVTFFTDDLLPAMAQGGIDQATVQRYFGLCYDVCHQAVMFEDIEASLIALQQAGIPIGKMQISNALSVSDAGRESTRKHLQGFAEPRYLHQVCTLSGSNTRVGRTDLADALMDESFPTSHPWRIHFHIPVQAEVLSPSEFGTTRNAIESALEGIASGYACPEHLEVETYSWSVLPGDQAPGNNEQLVICLAKELDWLEQKLSVLGLLSE